MVVREELQKLGLHFIFIEQGEIEVMETLSDEKSELLKIELFKSGLELLDDKNTILIESIKNTLIDLIYKSDDSLKMNFSEYLSQKFNIDYKSMSAIFLEVHGMKIDQFIMNHTIERIKELIIYEDLDILEIAQKLHFSNVAKLHIQFKKATGFSPYNFKQLKIKRRKVVESI
jgi:AraC-like DNA-binding protein